MKKKKKILLVTLLRNCNALSLEHFPALYTGDSLQKRLINVPSPKTPPDQQLHWSVLWSFMGDSHHRNISCYWWFFADFILLVHLKKNNNKKTSYAHWHSLWQSRLILIRIIIFVMRIFWCLVTTSLIHSSQFNTHTHTTVKS